MITILSEVDINKQDIRRVIGKCDCGKTKEFNLYRLTGGLTNSCGCMIGIETSKRQTTHGLTKHPIFNVFKKMKDRCYNPKHESYKDYGGRGIIICDLWKNNFTEFYNWCIKNNWQKGLQIDRVNNDGNYEPSNCQITTPKINSVNKRNTIRLTYNGRTMALSQWCEELGLEHETMRYRIIKKNMTPEQAFNTPIQNKWNNVR